MSDTQSNATIGVLASGGLDSGILIAHLLEKGQRVQPFYVRCGLVWEAAELAGLRAFLRAIAEGTTAGLSSSEMPTISPGTAGQAGSGTLDSQWHAALEELVVFDLPLRDLYGRHWSVDGSDAPDDRTPAGAVYLPGRNLLLAVKPAIWCGMRGIGQMAMALLAGNPFGDATDRFFRELEATLAAATGNRLEIVRPFAGMDKTEVLRLGRDLPLELTFSCLAPKDGLHCGRCNKCAERRKAFQLLDLADPTIYNETGRRADGR